MTLFRGWADDLDLSTWLETKIWPAEAKLRPEDVFWGTKLACLEMIKTGTTTFNDMYFHMDQAAKAVKEMGLRAFLSEGIVDLNDPERAAKQLRAAEETNRRIQALKTERITPVFGPHADRKSTRLNSSHLVISYAVFCLKKKTKASRFASCSSWAPSPPPYQSPASSPPSSPAPSPAAPALTPSSSPRRPALPSSHYTAPGTSKELQSD